MAKSLIDTINATPFYGLAVTFCETGYNVSIEYPREVWSPHEFAACASDAILKCIAKHGPQPAATPAPLTPPPDLPPLPVIVAPPPY